MKITKKERIYRVLIIALSIILIHNLFQIKSYAVSTNPTTAHYLSQIVTSIGGTLRSLDEDGNGKIDGEVLEGASFDHITYVIGATPTGLSSAQIIWKNTAESIDFNEVFEKKTFSATEIAGLPSPFESTDIIHQGLRCREENGWHLAACASAGTPDHVLYANGCYNKDANGLTVACIKY